VTVLVTTDRTLTGRAHALRGASKYLLPLLSSVQSEGENGDRIALTVALRGESLPGEQRGEGGMRRRRSPVGDRADRGRAKGDGGTPTAAADAGGDLWFSHRQKEKVLELEVGGSEVGVDLPEDSSKVQPLPEALLGLPAERTGVRVLRKSV
jgi:hypothetical protein